MGLFGKSKFAESGDGKDEIIEVLRKATNKHLTRPDVALNQRVVSAINTAPSEVDGRSIAALFIGRMRQENPHKQWLTIVLSQRVLRDCKDRLAEGKQELLQEIASIAAKPVATHIVNASAAQKAKQEAFMVLQEHGQEGMDAMSTAGGAGAVNLLVNEQAGRSGRYEQPAAFSSEYDIARIAAGTVPARSAGSGLGLAGGFGGSSASWPDTKALVTKDIAVAKNQTEVLQDMLKNFREGRGSHDRTFYDELTAQMVQMRMTFEAHMGRLAGFQTDDAQVLMADAIEAVEKMNAALEQYNECMKNPPKPTPGITAPAEGPSISLIDLADSLPEPQPQPPSAPTTAAAAAAPGTGGVNALLDDLLAPAPAPAFPTPPAQPAQLSPAHSGGNPFGAPLPPAVPDAPPAASRGFGCVAPPPPLQVPPFGGPAAAAAAPSPAPAQGTFPGFSPGPATSPFGSDAQFGAGSSMGAPSPSPVGSVSGGFAAPSPVGGSAFGAPASTTAPASGMGVPSHSPGGSIGGGFEGSTFGAPSPVPSSTSGFGSSAFGVPSPAPSATSGFGGSAFGAPSPAPSANNYDFGGNAFPSPAPSPAYSGSGFAGSSPAPMGPSPTPGSNPFASPTAAAVPVNGGAFGMAPPSPGLSAGGSPYGPASSPEPNLGLLSLGKQPAGPAYDTTGPLAELDPLPAIKAPKEPQYEPRGTPMRPMGAAPGAGVTASISPQAPATALVPKAPAAAPAADAFDELLTRR